jgi:16S rRNA (uracil1498-N3)-methyltransferase
MSLPTFYLENGFAAGDQAEIRGREAWHALGVRRLSLGDSIRLIDGRGSVGVASVERIDGPRQATLRVGECTRAEPLRPDVLLACALAKGDRQATLLDMACQLGVNGYRPLDCARSVTRMGKNSLLRWQKVCLEACKQSGNAWLPRFLPLVTPQVAVAEALAERRQVFFAHPAGKSLAEIPAAERLAVLVGPEGGFSDSEVVAMQQAGAIAVTLGPNILRIEAAAISLLARFRLA